MLEMYPKTNGSPPVMSSSVKTTVSCLQCIRSGWIWCSTKWHYSSAVALSDGTEKQCCDPSINTKPDDMTLSNSTTCSLRFTNTSIQTVQLKDHVDTGNNPLTAKWTSGLGLNWTFWCSDFNTSKSAEELAIINCPQNTSICGTN